MVGFIIYSPYSYKTFEGTEEVHVLSVNKRQKGKRRAAS